VGSSRERPCARAFPGGAPVLTAWPVRTEPACSGRPIGWERLCRRATWGTCRAALNAPSNPAQDGPLAAEMVDHIQGPRTDRCLPATGGGEERLMDLVGGASTTMGGWVHGQDGSEILLEKKAIKALKKRMVVEEPLTVHGARQGMARGEPAAQPPRLWCRARSTRRGPRRRVPPACGIIATAGDRPRGSN